jgi:hypothetical protein
VLDKRVVRQLLGLDLPRHSLPFDLVADENVSQVTFDLEIRTIVQV